MAELREVGPPPYPNGRGYGVQRKWSNFFEGADAFAKLLKKPLKQLPKPHR